LDCSKFLDWMNIEYHRQLHLLPHSRHCFHHPCPLLNRRPKDARSCSSPKVPHLPRHDVLLKRKNENGF
jgi:hypothetical protein